MNYDATCAAYSAALAMAQQLADRYYWLEGDEDDALILIMNAARETAHDALLIEGVDNLSEQLDAITEYAAGHGMVEYRCLKRQIATL